MSDWSDVASALLGSWPTQVAAWGRAGMAAFLGEVRSRGATPDGALVAIRRRKSAFPPSAGELAADGLRDPSTPTFTEAFRAIDGPHGVLVAREPYAGPVREPAASRQRAALARAAECHPLIGAFIESYGLARLRLLEVDHPEYGELRRNDLGAEWERFLTATEGRDLAALGTRRRGEIGRLDPLAALPEQTTGGEGREG